MVDTLQRSRHASFLLQIGGGKAFVSRFLMSGSLQHEGRKLPPATARQVKPERTTKPCRPGSKGAGSAQYSGMCVGRGQEFHKVMGWYEVTGRKLLQRNRPFGGPVCLDIPNGCITLEV